jgi:hypothetical protein
MPQISNALDAQGYAFIYVFVNAPGPRLRALQRVGQPIPQPFSGRALIDTGAGGTIIDPSVRQALNLLPFTFQSISVPSSPVPVRAALYKVDLSILHPVCRQFSPAWSMVSVVETPITHLGSDVLLGCDLLSQCQLLYNGPSGDFSLAY